MSQSAKDLRTYSLSGLDRCVVNLRFGRLFGNIIGLFHLSPFWVVFHLHLCIKEKMLMSVAQCLVNCWKSEVKMFVFCFECEWVWGYFQQGFPAIGSLVWIREAIGVLGIAMVGSGFCVEFVFVGNLLGQVILWCCWRKILLHPISSRGCCSQRLVYWRTRALKPKFSNIAEFRIRTRDQLLSLLRKARSLKPESFPRVK